jgi:TonB family protein
MRIIITFAMLLALAFPARASSTEPIPQGLVKYKDDDLPLYGRTQVHPVSTVKPKYPTSERRNMVQGSALILTIVDADGKVIDARITSSEPTAAFGVAAKESVLRWRYEKILKDGKPTRFAVEVPVSFSIR